MCQVMQALPKSNPAPGFEHALNLDPYPLSLSLHGAAGQSPVDERVVDKCVEHCLPYAWWLCTREYKCVDVQECEINFKGGRLRLGLRLYQNNMCVRKQGAAKGLDHD